MQKPHKIIFVLFIISFFSFALYGQKYKIDWDALMPEAQTNKFYNVVLTDTIDNCITTRDANGRITDIECGEAYFDNDYSHTVYEYDKEGRLVYYGQTNGNIGGDYATAHHKYYTFDARGNYYQMKSEYLSGVTGNPYVQTTDYINTYSGDLLVSVEVIYSTKSTYFNTSTTENTMMSYLYYDSLYLIKRVDYDIENSISTLYEYKYNEDHLLDTLNQLVIKEHIDDYSNQNNFNHLFNGFSKEPTITTVYKYDNSRLVFKKEINKTDKTCEEQSYEYDEFGNISKIIYSDCKKKSEHISKFHYKYIK